MGGLKIKNRIVMPPMSTRLSNPDGSVTQRLIEYYEARARGGVGLIIIEYSYTDRIASKAAVCQLGAYSDDLIPGLNDLVERLHFYDTKVFLQICHGGGQSPSSLIKRTPLAPSSIPSKSGEIPDEMTLEEISGIVKSFGEAALRAKRSGFDGVEIHGAHGYLANQFLSPIYNKRTDAYGPDFKSRTRFPLELVSEIKKKVGIDFPVGFRLNMKDYIPGGIELEETLEFIKMLQEAKITYVHASAGTYLSHQYMISPPYIQRGHLEELAKKCKEEVSVPIIAVGGINHEVGPRILENDSADLVAIGRALIADPELPVKLRDDRTSEIRPCIRCNTGCIGRFFEGKSMRCAVNPPAGRESTFVLEATPSPKKVVIIGGGVAGMEVTRIAKQRGHEVILLEKSESLGGNVSVAAVPDFKSDLGDLISWYIYQLSQLGIEPKLNFHVTPSLLNKLNPDMVILASGAEYFVPEIEGISGKNVITSTEALTETKQFDNNIVIIGAGLVGIETAMHLNSKFQGRKIAVLDSLSEPLSDVVRVNKLAIMERLEGTDIEIITSAIITRITNDEVQYLDADSTPKAIAFDTIVLAAGFVSTANLDNLSRGMQVEVFKIGDYRKSGKIFDAINSAADLALRI